MKFNFFLRENSKSFIHLLNIVIGKWVTDIEKNHNDEKVMIEVKSISREVIEEPKFNGNLRTGGTDHRQRNLIYQIR